MSLRSGVIPEDWPRREIRVAAARRLSGGSLTNYVGGLLGREDVGVDD